MKITDERKRTKKKQQQKKKKQKTKNKDKKEKRVTQTVVKVQIFKNMRLFFLSDMFLNPSFKIIANVARPIVSTKKIIY